MFDKDYWKKNYSDPETMDGICNAKEHCRYMKSLFELDGVDINSVIDFGFGLGHLFKESLKTFYPYKAYAIEPSEYAFKKAKLNKLKYSDNMKLKYENIDMLTWLKRNISKREVFDLGLCTSVLQYINDSDCKKILPLMSKKVRYLYLTAPTNIELDKQINELGFKDEYALRRSKTRYFQLISPHFTFVSNRLLESKHFFDKSTTLFSEYLFRF